MILGCTLLLLGLGIVMVFSASSVTEYANTGSHSASSVGS